MKILLANPRGFCAGVNSAIGVVNEVLDICGPPIWVYHEIVHNQHVVERFRERGVRFVEGLAEVPEGAIVVFSAHGVGPAIRQEAAERRLQAIDATCPLVTKVHMEALRYARNGFQILFIGHNGHDEVVGTVGEAPESIQVVESPADIPKLDIRDPRKLVFLMQTTLSVDDAETIVAALRRAFPDIHEPPSDDICYATTNRQQAVRQIAPECDLVVVVGSTNSSNSVRLTEIAESQGTAACLVDDIEGLDLTRLSGEETVLVTAGASAPEDLVEEIVLTLYERFGGEVEQRDVFEETVEFDLPGSLKTLLREHDVDPSGRKIVAAHASLQNGLYAGVVPLTVSAAGPGKDTAAP